MTALEQVLEALESARRVYRENKAAGSPAESLAYDAGRIAGLEDAAMILEQEGIE